MVGRRLSRHAPVLLVAVAIGAGGCSDQKAAPQGFALSGLHASLKDRVRPAGHGRIAWHTYWRLCWAATPGAVAYEVLTVTSEGVSPHVRRQHGRCVRTEVAAGENPRSRGLFRRDLQISLQSSQLAYRVRAVAADGRTTAWSVPAAVGETKPGPSRPTP